MRPTDLLHANYIGAKELREKISQLLHSTKPQIVTEHGRPRQVLIAYDTLVELIDILEELRDRHLMKRIGGARKSYRRSGGVPLTRLAKDLGLAV